MQVKSFQRTFLHCELGGPLRKRRATPGGSQPIAHGMIVLPGKPEWPTVEIDTAANMALDMIPRASFVIAPVLAAPEGWRPAVNYRERLDFRPIETRFGNSCVTTDGCYMPILDVIFVSASATTSPTDIMAHEIWHYTECNILTDTELGEVAALFLAVQQTGRAGGMTPSEWCAQIFALWLKLWNATASVRMGDPLETLFHALASGRLSGRMPFPLSEDIDAAYARLGRSALSGKTIKAKRNLRRLNGYIQHFGIPDSIQIAR